MKNWILKNVWMTNLLMLMKDAEDDISNVEEIAQLSLMRLFSNSL